MKKHQSRVTDTERKKSKVDNNNLNDFVAALPREISELIPQMLDVVDYHRFSAVCKTWRSVAVAAKQNQLHAVTSDYQLVLIELNPHPKCRKVDMPCPEGLDCEIRDFIELTYLVECCGELLMVVRRGDVPTSYVNVSWSSIHPLIITFKVFKLDSSGGRWIKVESLGDEMLFVGTSSGISLSASGFSGFRGNCIYFTPEFFWDLIATSVGSTVDSDLGVFGLGVFCLDDGSIKSFLPTEFGTEFGTEFLSFLSPPVWYMPMPRHRQL